MNKEALQECIQKEGQFSFSRSGGPGGQNVNKVNTKVLLTLPMESLAFCLSEEEINRVRGKLTGRINSRDELFLQFQEERSQLMNRERSVDKMAELIENSLKVQKKRKKTRPGRAAKEKRLNAKKKQGEKKKSRSRISIHD
ncbi:MAG: alternative ribosome rescue aminoacyl-tRNA hydrolase ArfB [Spirochaetales bacterium]|nr:alternative ribosome rescue aminoacyl-tRNA hydrolase ArfB [Spirochaetales bacterium]